jgi:hypothetical protein
MNDLKQEILVHVLSNMLRTKIIGASYEAKQLHGGTLGDVQLVMGTAETADNRKIPYKVVLKSQKKWERPGDPDSWRREYDLYASELGKSFNPSLRRPECYYAELGSDEAQLWLEYIDGLSGSSLAIEMLEQAALEWGRFQGKLFSRVDGMERITCLGDTGFMERDFNQWHTRTFTYDFLVSDPCRIPGFLKQMLKDGEIWLIDGKSLEYSYLRSRGCGIPEHLKNMLIDIDDRKDDLFDKLKSLPVVLCHRDFWNENIFFSGGQIRLIDWDTAGWGFPGEDIASLIFDDRGAETFEESYRRLVPAYRKGLSDYMTAPAAEDLRILEMALVKFGYRMLQECMFSETPVEKSRGVHALQKIYEMRKAEGIGHEAVHRVSKI